MSGKTSRMSWIVFCLFVGMALCASGLEISTEDGLVLRVDEATGEVNRLNINGRELALFSGTFGGLRFYEPTPVTSQDTIFHEDFNGTEIAWNSAIMDNWEASAIFLNHRASFHCSHRQFRIDDYISCNCMSLDPDGCRLCG